MKQKQLIENAEKLINSVPAGTELIFEGSCPSGTTYSSRCTWDGTEEMRAMIMARAKELSGPHAWRAQLVAVRDVRQGIIAAKMRR